MQADPARPRWAAGLLPRCGVCCRPGPSRREACCISSRILAPAERYDEVVINVTDTIATAKQGDPFEEDTDFGPVATRSQLDTVMGHADSGHAEESAPPPVDVRPT